MMKAFSLRRDMCEQLIRDGSGYLLITGHVKYRGLCYLRSSNTNVNGWIFAPDPERKPPGVPLLRVGGIVALATVTDCTRGEDSHIWQLKFAEVKAIEFREYPQGRDFYGDAHEYNTGTAKPCECPRVNKRVAHVQGCSYGE